MAVAAVEAPGSAAPVAAGSSTDAASAPEASTSGSSGPRGTITYRQYKDEHDLPAVMELIDKDLSEPYSIFTYRYFLRQWPQLCYLAEDGGEVCGVVVCKMDMHGDNMRGYLAMLVVDKRWRGKGIGSALAKMAIQEMVAAECHEVVLEAEVTNAGALALYRSLGFIRDKRLHRYYLNGSDAFRLKLKLPLTEEMQRKRGEEEQLRRFEDLSLHHHQHDEGPGALVPC